MADSMALGEHSRYYISSIRCRLQQRRFLDFSQQPAVQSARSLCAPLSQGLVRLVSSRLMNSKKMGKHLLASLGLSLEAS